MTFGPMSFSIRAWAGFVSSPQLSVAKAIPPLLRRRATAMGRNVLDAACGLPDIDKARYVFSSRHGEFTRTLAILKSIAQGAPLSPADFSMSVHHALAGLLSIVQKNHGGHVAIAAGEESFCFGLIEAIACLAENPDEPVMLIHSDEPLPESYDVFGRPDEQPIGLAVLLGEKAGDAERQVFSVEAAARTDQSAATDAMAVAFLDFLQGTANELNCIGETRHWRWVRHGLG